MFRMVGLALRISDMVMRLSRDRDGVQQGLRCGYTRASNAVVLCIRGC